MKLKRAMTAVACSALLAACSSTPTQQPPQAAAPAPAPATSSAPAAPAAAQAVASESVAEQLARISKGLDGKSIYFAYDKYDIQPQYQDTLLHLADLLKSGKDVSVRLEGNADERGSAEYNLALGQKRAESVRHALALLGLSDGRMEAISYGKEKPRATCHEEKCWSQNRRVDLTAKKPDIVK